MAIQSWEQKNSGEAFSCNGPYFQECRKRRGLTQGKTAAITGFSTRLVRKAEAGERLRGNTIATLAKAYHTPQVPVHCEDLTINPISLAKRFLKAYATKEAEMVEEIRDILAEDVIFKMGEEGDPVPFSGVYHGEEGITECWRRFFATFDRPDKQFFKPKFLQIGNDVISVCPEMVQTKGSPEIHTNHVTFHFQFNRGKLTYIEDTYDKEIGINCIKAAIERGAYANPKEFDIDIEKLFNSADERREQFKVFKEGKNNINRFL